MWANSKIKVLVITVVLFASFALAGCAAVPAANQPAVPTANQAVVSSIPAITTVSPGTNLVDLTGNVIVANKLTVSATGSKKVEPDVAYLTVGVTTQGSTAKKAQDKNTEIMNALYTALEAAGLAQEDIETVNYYVYPRYDYTNGNGEISGYDATNTIQLTIRDPNTVGKYIDIARDNGANADYSISFDLLDSTAFYNEALADAVAKARSKADTIAVAGGYQIINTLEITESQGYYSPQYRGYDMAAEAAGSPTPVSSGLIEITANVTIIYQIQ